MGAERNLKMEEESLAVELRADVAAERRTVLAATAAAMSY